MVDRVVQQLAEHVLRDARDGRVQLQHRVDVAQPRRVLVEPGDRVLVGDLALDARFASTPAKVRAALAAFSKGLFRDTFITK